MRVKLVHVPERDISRCLEPFEDSQVVVEPCGVALLSLVRLVKTVHIVETEADRRAEPVP